ncbi:MAG: hypothetical protein Q9192_003088 [Flavoplaca navasiana]
MAYGMELVPNNFLADEVHREATTGLRSKNINFSTGLTMANITDVIPQLDTVPQCIYPAYQTIAAAGCGLDLKCICTDDLFFATTQVVFAKGVCSPLEAQGTSTKAVQPCPSPFPTSGSKKARSDMDLVTE